MPKEKNYNPVQAQRKADKAREVKKGKAEAKGRRDEKLARKNPERIQKQIDDLKAVAAKGGKLSRHEEQVLDGLERELKAVQRARDALGDKAPSLSRAGWARDGNARSGGSPFSLGKRRRRGGEGESDSDEEESIPEDVREIPMPRDTPPPIPKAEMDKWYAKRRAKREAMRRQTHRDEEDADADAAAAQDRDKKAKVEVESKTVYEAKPVVRDLRKEAVAAFVPTSVQMKMTKGKGQGGLMEPEEADRLEKEGYLKTGGGGGEQAAESSTSGGLPPRHVMVEDADEDD